MAETARVRHLHLVTAAGTAAVSGAPAADGTAAADAARATSPAPSGRTPERRAAPAAGDTGQVVRPARGGEPLWRDVLGDHLRALRHERGERLADTAGRAGVSPQYLSEMERGLKEPSSEMIAAVAGALDLTLADLTLGVARSLRSGRPAGPVCRAPLALAA